MSASLYIRRQSRVIQRRLGSTYIGLMLRHTPTALMPVMTSLPRGRSFMQHDRASCGGGHRQQRRPPAVPAAGRSDEAAVL